MRTKLGDLDIAVGVLIEIKEKCPRSDYIGQAMRRAIAIISDYEGYIKNEEIDNLEKELSI